MPETVLTDGLEAQERRFDEQLEAWLANVKTVHADEDVSFLRSLVPTTEQLPRITAVIRQLTADIIARCTDRRWSDQELQEHIRNVAYFLQRFDEIIRPYQHSETMERPWFLRTGNSIFGGTSNSENFIGKRQPNSATLSAINWTNYAGSLLIISESQNSSIRTSIGWCSIP